jgi:hypothetical protein
MMLRCLAMKTLYALAFAFSQALWPAPAAAAPIPNVNEQTVIQRIPVSLWQTLAVRHTPDATGKPPHAWVGPQTVRIVSYWASYSVAAHDPAAAETALRIIDYAFAHQVPGGGFVPAPGARHPPWGATVFVEDLGHSMLLLQTDAKQAAAAHAALTYLMANRDEVATDRDAANRIFRSAGAYYLAGKAVGDSDAMQTGETFLKTALERQTPDGTFLEAGGFDSSYQCVGLVMAQVLFMHMPVSDPLRAQLWPAIVRGIAREERSVLPSGQIVTAGNTRVGPDSLPGKHELDAENAILAFQYYAALTQDASAQSRAASVLAYYRTQI